ncbi:MAG TPA: ribokinase, partial [Brevundimonas sp.]|nr:ribokinase [Brevundimonas sp.]
VGAGDTLGGALTVTLLQGMTTNDALHFACAAGALAATRPGAQPSLGDRAEVEALMAQGSA